MSKMRHLAVMSGLGVGLNLAGSMLQDAFWHLDHHGWSDWGFTALSLRATGIGLVAYALLRRFVVTE